MFSRISLWENWILIKLTFLAKKKDKIGIYIYNITTFNIKNINFLIDDSQLLILYNI